MIELQVENLSIEDFIYILNTRKFSTLEDFDDFIRNFFKDFEASIRRNVSQEIYSKLKNDARLKAISEEKEYYQVMELIDERIMERAIYMKKIADKNKYKGRYDYSGHNSKRKTQER